MSPHQRASSRGAGRARSPGRSGRGGWPALGSGIVVVPPPLRCPAVQSGGAHQPGDALAAVPAALARRARRGRAGRRRCRRTRRGPAVICSVSSASRTARGTGGAGAAGVEGGSGDLQQLTRPLDAVPPLLLRLDERVHRSPGLLREESRGPLEDLHVLAQPAVLPPQRGQLLALAAGQPVARSPASTSACFTQSRTAVSVRSKSLAT